MPEQVVKLKKKQWYPIIAPKQFGEVILGETLVFEPRAMLGKTLSNNLMSLTNDVKKQNINIYFKVVDVEGNKGMTSIIGYEIIPSSVKRFVRRNSEKMDLSFTCDTADNVLLRVKPLVITKADVKGSVAAKMRNSIIQLLTRIIKKSSYNDLMNDLISHKLQAEMRAVLNKIYPVKVCEIRYVMVCSKDKKDAKEESEKQQEETQSAEIEPAQEKA